MQSIDEFAQRAANLFLESQQGIQEDFYLGLQRQAVEEFIKTVFYASLIPDEGRYPSVCLMSYRKDDALGFHFLFPAPIQPSAQQIAKLAHATAPDSHICCICKEGQITLGGVHVTMLNKMRELGYASHRVANPLKLLIKSPGHIEMSSGGIALIYREGEISEEALFRHSYILSKLAEVISHELEDLTNGTVESLSDIFNDLAKAIVRLGHGGIIIVGNEPKKSQFASIRETDCLLLQDLLFKYWDDISTLLASAGGIGNVLRRNAEGVVDPIAFAVASDTTMLENCITSIAHLAGMDGAIVMTYDCKVGGFNAIIDKAASEGVPCRLVDKDAKDLQWMDIMQGRGSRHQSALAYAMRVPHSFTLVISQDGGVAAFHNPADGTVVCEMGMRVLD